MIFIYFKLLLHRKTKISLENPRDFRTTISKGDVYPFDSHQWLELPWEGLHSGERKSARHKQTWRGSVAKETKGFKMNMKPDATVVIWQTTMVLVWKDLMCYVIVIKLSNEKSCEKIRLDVLEAHRICIKWSAIQLSITLTKITENFAAFSHLNKEK